MRRGKDVAAQVVTPDGLPATGAKVALGLDRPQITIRSRPVVGKLAPRDGFDGVVRWNFAIVEVKLSSRKDDRSASSITATVGRDGTFRFDDVPAGDYTLEVDSRYAGEISSEKEDLGTLVDHCFQVPATEADSVGPPVDLGTLRLEASTRR